MTLVITQIDESTTLSPFVKGMGEVGVKHLLLVVLALLFFYQHAVGISTIVSRRCDSPAMATPCPPARHAYQRSKSDARAPDRALLALSPQQQYEENNGKINDKKKMPR